MLDVADRIHVGVAGWDYRDWKDTVYRLPSEQRQLELFELAAPKKARYAPDPLAFLAQHVDMIEINSSFYRIPSPRSTERWVTRVSDQAGFFFTAKLNSKFTHDFCTQGGLARQFREGFEPIQETGLLRGILAQFRYDFGDTPANRNHLQWIRSAFADYCPLIVEIRHRSWQAEPGLRFFEGLGVTVANLDYPTARDSFDLYNCSVGSSAYLRLHGRNHEAWFSADTSVEETYNYDYSEGEIQSLVKRSRAILGDVKELTIVANNHYQGKAVSAALRLKSGLTGKKVRVPPSLLETYPHLKRILERGN